MNIAKHGTLTWEQDDRCLPFPIDWKDKNQLVPLAVESSGFLDALDREMLTVTGLTAPRYAVKIDGIEAGQFTAAELAKGINLAGFANTPMMNQAMVVHQTTLKRTTVHNFRWRSIQVPMASEDLPSEPAALAALDKLDADLAAEQHNLAQPKPHRYEIAPVSDR